MRSGAVAWFLDVYGFNVLTLRGGYKTYRNYIVESFRKPLDINIVGGYTGSSKTEILKKLQRLGESVINLEELAKLLGRLAGGS